MTAAIFDCWDDMRVLTIDDADGELVDFIANAPADLAWLLEENARLTGQVAELEADKTDLRACAEDYAAFEAERVAQVNFLNSLHTRSTAVTGEKS
ncbi:hypothetical protein [uncultured Friedmanniella sp.]|uniref:hypothetical protein n=1 Tax=uncultured Friedmanniella sp. TaxID=335381 RepID=UPI0035C99F3B